MYYYPYPYYYVNTPVYNSEMTRNHQEQHQQVQEAILTEIKKEASALELYRRLVAEAPNQKHKNNLLRAIDDKKDDLTQYTNLYFTITGRQPVYQTDKVSFNSYREGIQKAYEAEEKGQEDYLNRALLTHHPLVRNVFMRACTSEKANARRFRLMNEEVGNRIKDYGPEPFVVNIEEVTKQNNTFRTALWTGQHLQLTLMSIDVGDDIGLEIHPDLDQFIRIEEGQGLVQMGDRKDRLDFEENVYDDFAFVIPAGKWHNLTNTGNKPLKLYSIYAPPQHPYGTVHETKEDALAAEENHHH